ncbi:hypothetical protein PAE4_60118 [Bacillus altitudinis]|uniref:Uncharacterized protein n=1 Tax=Bacillus altitudinis TaxID=293387 RepID=A0A653MME0_BACAB|nr:hypothetical protein PAE4_60118 [Bacillus altitudinis]VXB00372.1 hypothetical protein BACI9J_120135 [Bacillus altitudinis]VXB06338.1 hypothetical protein BACI348_30135 [Bacillus altitudinis]
MNRVDSKPDVGQSIRVHVLIFRMKIGFSIKNFHREMRGEDESSHSLRRKGNENE